MNTINFLHKRNLPSQFDQLMDSQHRKIHVHNPRSSVLILYYADYVTGLPSNEVLYKLMVKLACIIPNQRPQMCQMSKPQAGISVVLCRVHRKVIHVQEQNLIIIYFLKTESKTKIFSTLEYVSLECTMLCHQ